ncbi:hypothetical protein ACSFA2_25445, partial [Variovorax sp. LT2P21]
MPLLCVNCCLRALRQEKPRHNRRKHLTQEVSQKQRNARRPKESSMTIAMPSTVATSLGVQQLTSA